jgi:16S rRNA (guanine527-N7)-methyltransferase
MPEMSPPARPVREPLPDDAAALPALGDAFTLPLRAALGELGLELGPVQLAALEVHARLLLAWNRHINLTAFRTAEQVALLHVVDSLTAVPLIRPDTSGTPRAGTPRLPRRPSLLDLGSGGGYPGLPLAVMVPCRQVALVDSVAKKARFLTVAAAAVTATLWGSDSEGTDIVAVPERAEDLAEEPDHREAWDMVTARAVGSLAEVAELSLPLLHVGGRLLCWKRDDGSGALASEIRAAQGVTRAAGGGRIRVHHLDLSALPGNCLIEVVKARLTPGHFPRTPADRRRTLIP